MEIPEYKYRHPTLAVDYLKKLCNIEKQASSLITLKDSFLDYLLKNNFNSIAETPGYKQSTK